MYILKAISEDGYAEVVDSTTGDISFIDEYQKAMLKNQGVLSVPANIEKLEFLLGVYEQNTLYLIARHSEELNIQPPLKSVIVSIIVSERKGLLMFALSFRSPVLRFYLQRAGRQRRQQREQITCAETKVGGRI